MEEPKGMPLSYSALTIPFLSLPCAGTAMRRECTLQFHCEGIATADLQHL